MGLFMKWGIFFNCLLKLGLKHKKVHMDRILTKDETKKEIVHILYGTCVQRVKLGEYWS